MTVELKAEHNQGFYEYRVFEITHCSDKVGLLHICEYFNPLEVPQYKFGRRGRMSFCVIT